MGPFSKQSDEEFRQKIVKESEDILIKAYDLASGQSSFPDDANIARPDKIIGVSYEKIDNSSLRLYIGCKATHSSFVRDGLRLSYEIIKKGSLLCKEVVSFKETTYNPNSSIKKGVFSSFKTLICPVGKTMSIEVVCKKIYIEEVGSFVMYNERLITLNEFLEIMSK